MANNTKNKTMTTSFTNNKQISKQIRLLTTTALFAALITIFTAYIGHVPVGTNGGYIPDPNKELAAGGDVSVYWKGFKDSVAQTVHVVDNKQAA